MTDEELRKIDVRIATEILGRKVRFEKGRAVGWKDVQQKEPSVWYPNDYVFLGDNGEPMLVDGLDPDKVPHYTRETNVTMAVLGEVFVDVRVEVGRNRKEEMWFAKIGNEIAHANDPALAISLVMIRAKK